MARDDDLERLRERVQHLEQRADRERRRREEAERIAERSTRDLYDRQRELEELAASLERRVEGRTEDLAKRLDQQRVLHEVGQFALRHVDVDGLVRELCERAAEVLDADFCDVFELRRDRGDLLLRAAVGFPEGAVGEATLDVAEGSQSGHTVRNREPTVVEDNRDDDRFRRPGLFEQVGVVSGITVVVPGPENPWGVFGVHASQPRAFNDHDVSSSDR